ncbi:MAG: alpha/beta hydrolase [Aridibacter sp.]
MTFKYLYKKPTKTNGENEKPPLLILLHGIGADENDLFGLAPFLDERFFIVSVQAPFVLPYGGFAWFELFIEPNKPIGYNAKQFEQSRQMIFEFVDEVVAEHDLDSKKVFLCGFSQGSMMSLSAALSEPEKFAGVVAMSGRAVTEMLSDDNFDALKDFPILVTHGTFDPVLPIENGRATKEILSRLPVRLEYKEYEMGHEISQESLRDVSNWLRVELDRHING